MMVVLSRTAEISPKTIYIFENTTNSIIPKRETRRHRTTARLHSHLREPSASRRGLRYKPGPSGTQARLPPAPSGRRGVGAGRERGPRTAKHPAPATRTRAQTQCMRGGLETRETGQQDL